MSKIYDLVIVGAGIAGCTLAYFCKDTDILLIDRASSPATGGSGAAGAFISPKLGKKTTLLELTNKAFYFSSQFYKDNFPEFFDSRGVLRIPKNRDDEANLELYKNIINSGEIVNCKKIGLKLDFNALFFKDGGVCDAQGLCKALIKDIPFLQLELKSLEKKNNIFLINNQIKSKKVVLATGYEAFSGLDYMGIKGLWGSRGDFYSDLDLKISLHQNISISANNNGIIKIGATHLRVKSANEACRVCSGEPFKELINEAKKIANIDELKLKETFCAMRASSKDYFPLLGEVIDINYMLKEYPKIKKGYNKAPIKYIKNLYVFNGLGGRGFVFAPYLAKILKDFIFENKALPKEINSDRLFLKWARKLT